MKAAEVFTLTLALFLVVSPALSSTEWFVRTGPDRHEVDYVPKGAEISIENYTELSVFAREKAVFNGNERFWLRSGSFAAPEGNASLKVEFSAENLTVKIFQLAGEALEVSAENDILVSGSSAEPVFEGPQAALSSGTGGRRTLSINGISFEEAGPVAVMISARDGEVYSVSGLAAFGSRRFLGFGAIPPVAYGILAPALLTIILSTLFFNLRRRKKSGERTEADEKRRREELNEIQKSVFEGRH